MGATVSFLGGNRKGNISLICLMLAVLFLIIGFVSSYTEKKAESYTKTTATIESIDTWYDANNELQGTAVIRYEANGKNYIGELGYNTGFAENGQVDIYYNPEDPQDIIYTTGGTPIFFILSGVMVVIAAVTFVLKRLRGR